MPDRHAARDPLAVPPRAAASEQPCARSSASSTASISVAFAIGWPRTPREHALDVLGSRRRRREQRRHAGSPAARATRRRSTPRRTPGLASATHSPQPYRLVGLDPREDALLVASSRRSSSGTAARAAGRRAGARRIGPASSASPAAPDASRAARREDVGSRARDRTRSRPTPTPMPRRTPRPQRPARHERPPGHAHASRRWSCGHLHHRPLARGRRPEDPGRSPVAADRDRSVRPVTTRGPPARA